MNQVIVILSKLRLINFVQKNITLLELNKNEDCKLLLFDQMNFFLKYLMAFYF
jgi:hypothetical protein